MLVAARPWAATPRKPQPLARHRNTDIIRASSPAAPLASPRTSATLRKPHAAAVASASAISRRAMPRRRAPGATATLLT